MTFLLTLLFSVEVSLSFATALQAALLIHISIGWIGSERSLFSHPRHPKVDQTSDQDHWPSEGDGRVDPGRREPGCYRGRSTWRGESLAIHDDIVPY
jgi:hypothetical protein